MTRPISTRGLISEEPTRKIRPRHRRIRQRQRIQKILRQQAHKSRELAKTASPDLFSLRQLEAWADLTAKEPQLALQKLQQADENHLGQPTYHQLLAEVHLTLGNLADAETAFQESLRLDPENPEGTRGLARCALRNRDYQAAIPNLHLSIQRKWDQPWTHYLLGTCHFRLAQWDQAEEALLSATRLSSCFPAPWRLLYQIYYRHKPDVAAAVHCQTEQSKARAELKSYLTSRPGQDSTPDETQPTGKTTHLQPADFTTPFSVLHGIPETEIITIVSGLPRSGTSLAMQMLVAGGIPALTDGKRAADESNPRGYLEFEPATQLARNKTWLPEAKGKVVKIVAQLLPFLPEKDRNGTPFHYRVLFTNRPMEDVLQSQQTMLSRNEIDSSSEGDLGQAYRHQMAQICQMLNRRNIPTFPVEFDQAIQDPAATAEQIAAHLSPPQLNIPAMIQVVEPKLKRSGNVSGN